MVRPTARAVASASAADHQVPAVEPYPEEEMSTPGPRPLRSPRERDRLRAGALLAAVAVLASLVTFIALTASSDRRAEPTPNGPPITGPFTESVQQRPVAPGSGSEDEEPSTEAEPTESSAPESVSSTPSPVPSSPATPSRSPVASTPRATPSPRTSAPATTFTFPALAAVHGRSAPRMDAKIVKRWAYQQGAKVPVVCQVKGGTAYGSVVWDRTPDGLYIADAYVETGYLSFSPKIPRC